MILVPFASTFDFVRDGRITLRVELGFPTLNLTALSLMAMGLI